MRLAPPVLVASALAAALAPRAAPALVREERTGPVSGQPLTVEPSPPFVQLWVDARSTLDAAPVGMTLSDGERWRSDALRPRFAFSGGMGIGPLAGELQAGLGTGALALQLDVIDRGRWKLGAAAAVRVAYGGGFDLSFVPVLATRRAVAEWLAIVPFGAVRARWGRTQYDVQGWDADRSSPFASATTRDLALAPMAGVALVARLAELRLTAGWELLLVDRLEWEERPTSFSRRGGPFAMLALRLRLRTPQ